MNKCPHCGAEVNFDPSSQLVHCDYCGSDFKPEEAISKEKRAKVEQFDGKRYVCTQCGASLLTFDDTAVTFCSYCGSQGMLEDKMVKEDAPEFIIPFSKTREECINNYKRKVNSFLFSPNYMKSDLVVNKFRGIYMPYGIYNLYFKGDCLNRGSRYSHRSGDYVYYDDYTIHADIDAKYDGISFDLLSKFYDEYSEAIPFNYQEAVPFNKNYLAGFYADAKDVQIGSYSPNAISIASHDSTRFMKKASAFKRYGCTNPVVNFNVREKKNGLFPVYFLAIRDKNDKYIHYAVINGQTGEVAADLPISFSKYVISSLALAIPIFFLVNAVPYILPIATNFFSIIVSIIAAIICHSQLVSIHLKDYHPGDTGYQSKYKSKVEKRKFQWEYAWKYIIAIFVALLPIFFKPVSDVPYYVASTISLLMIVWSFYDLTKLHNLVVSKKIPQLEKRGGDENA